MDGDQYPVPLASLRSVVSASCDVPPASFLVSQSCRRQTAAVRATMRGCVRRARSLPTPHAATERKLDAAAEAMQREVMPGLLATRQRLEARPELMAILAPALQGMENDL